MEAAVFAEQGDRLGRAREVQDAVEGAQLLGQARPQSCQRVRVAHIGPAAGNPAAGAPQSLDPGLVGRADLRAAEQDEVGAVLARQVLGQAAAEATEGTGQQIRSALAQHAPGGPGRGRDALDPAGPAHAVRPVQHARRVLLALLGEEQSGPLGRVEHTLAQDHAQGGARQHLGERALVPDQGVEGGLLHGVAEVPGHEQVRHLEAGRDDGSDQRGDIAQLAQQGGCSPGPPSRCPVGQR